MHRRILSFALLLAALIPHANAAAPARARLAESASVQPQLMDPRRLGPGPDCKAAELIRPGKSIVLVTCGIPSTEVGSYLSGILVAPRLASSDEPEILEILGNAVILLVP